MTSQKTDWHFAEKLDDTPVGWDDASIKSFKGDAINNLAREIIQNSLDAADRSAGCVRVSFKSHSVDTTDIPNVKTLRGVIDACLRSAEEADKPKILLAKRQADDKLVRILSVSESGTTGMAGPCKRGYPFFKYMKATSQSGKSADSRGSHGLGKAAPIACSHLHTIFASTIYQDDNGNEKSLVMGRATLSSRYDGDEEKPYSNVGFWGTGDFKPVPYTDELPAWLKREERGTDIHIIAFNGPKEWEWILAPSVICNFFTAIHEGILEVEIGKLMIDAKSLPEMFCAPKILKIVKESRSKEAFEVAEGLYQAFVSREIEDSAQITHLGQVKFYMRHREDASEKHIGLVRDDMFITSDIPYHLKRYPRTWGGFDVLIKPVDGSLIRDMEPPAHDAIQEYWIDDEDARKKATLALKQLAEKTKVLLEKHFGNPTSDTDDSDIGLDWFPEESDSGRDEDDDPMAGFKFVLNPPPQPSIKSSAKNEVPDESEIGDDGGSGEAETGGGDQPGVGPGHGAGEGGTGDRDKTARKIREKLREQPIELQNVRMVRLADQKLRLIFHPTIEGKILLAVSEIGADAQKTLSITSTNRGHIKDGMVEIPAKKGQKSFLEVETEDYTGRSILLAATRAK